MVGRRSSRSAVAYKKAVSRVSEKLDDQLLWKFDTKIAGVERQQINALFLAVLKSEIYGSPDIA